MNRWIVGLWLIVGFNSAMWLLVVLLIASGKNETGYVIWLAIHAFGAGFAGSLAFVRTIEALHKR